MNDNLIRRDVFGTVLAAMAGAVVAYPAAGIARDAEPDPVYAEIMAARGAEDAFRAALAALPDDHSDDEADAAEQVGFVSDEAMEALMRTRPTTFAGLCALIRFLGDEDLKNEGRSTLMRLADLLQAGPALP